MSSEGPSVRGDPKIQESEVPSQKTPRTGALKRPVRESVLPCGRPLKGALAHADPIDQGSARERLERFVAAGSLKRSEVRHRILDVIVNEAPHFSAPELVRRVQASHPEIGAATIYRNLPVLLEAGLIQESLMTREGHKLYELSDDDHHDHIVCTDCRRIFEFHDDTIEARQEKLIRAMGFRTDHHRHVIYASCEYAKKGT